MVGHQMFTTKERRILETLQTAIAIFLVSKCSRNMVGQVISVLLEVGGIHG